CSDLDFFVIARPGAKRRFLDNLDWLAAPAPLDFVFRNTADGCKALAADGAFYEFAVFEPAELAAIPFAEGRIVWAAPDADPALASPSRPAAAPAPPSREWLLGEALTNLYVGLQRLRRGELLSAARFIQGYALDRVLELMEQDAPAAAAGRDPFAPDRRCEERLPELAAELPAFAQGYARSRESAIALLEFLERRFTVEPAMARAIRALG
ncbi:MAG TPA: hypothetical protein VGE07_14830, partial [Herpetosiphonaceae bacterium]